MPPPPPASKEEDGTKAIWITICIVIAVTALCVVLYGTYKKVRAQQLLAQEVAIVKRGQQELQDRYVNADGTLNDAAFQVDWDALRSDTAQQVPKPPPTLSRKVAKALKSGTLLHSMNRMATSMTNMSGKITEKLEKRNQAKETSEEREEREKYAKLADDAVNPLFPLRMRQLREQREKEREEQQRAYERAQATQMMDAPKQEAFTYNAAQAAALAAALGGASTAATNEQT